MAAAQTAVERSYAQAGTGQQMTVDPSIGGSHWGRLNVVLKAGTDATTEQQIQQLFRDTVASMPDVVAKIDAPQLFNLTKPMEIELSGHELPALKNASDLLSQRMAQDQRFCRYQIQSARRATGNYPSF